MDFHGEGGCCEGVGGGVDVRAEPLGSHHVENVRAGIFVEEGGGGRSRSTSSTLLLLVSDGLHVLDDGLHVLEGDMENLQHLAQKHAHRSTDPVGDERHVGLDAEVRAEVDISEPHVHPAARKEKKENGGEEGARGAGATRRGPSAALTSPLSHNLEEGTQEWLSNTAQGCVGPHLPAMMHEMHVSVHGLPANQLLAP